MNEKKKAIITTVPAAKELWKVPGFDPLNYLRTVSRNGEKVLKLDLRYKKLWFRLACPSGKMWLNPLRITDQMAIFEARLYADRDDSATFLASFTSTQMARDVPGGLYIRAAQDEALNEALDNAGFGIQLCDVAQVSDGSGFGSEIPLSQVVGSAQAAEDSAEVPVEHSTAEAADTLSPSELAVESDTSEAPCQEAGEKPVEGAGERGSISDETASQAQNEVCAGDTPQTADNITTLPAAVPPETDEHMESDGRTPPQSGYTEDMSVEEICEHMTLEQARDILVPLGTCKGWTLGQVADRRAASLRWYVVGCQDASNILKAGATLLWNDRQAQQAS